MQVLFKIAEIIDDAVEQGIILREIDVLSQIKGDHMVQLVDMFRTANNLYIFKYGIL